eukprot:EC713704.1.p2 GENE.EC713704.1~~EC713704.1.p2  ORF type:complete len:76 (-),score=3.17 EC713704.1:48-275(-)
MVRDQSKLPISAARCRGCCHIQIDMTAAFTSFAQIGQGPRIAAQPHGRSKLVHEQPMKGCQQNSEISCQQDGSQK